jgi:hypothetical protein
MAEDRKMAITVTVYADERRWAALIDDHGRTERLSGIRVSKMAATGC